MHRAPPSPLPRPASGPHAARPLPALAAETLGTAGLLAVVTGAGIMAGRLSAGNAAVALLSVSLAVAAALWVLVELFGPISGAHFNPVVSAVLAWRGALPPARLPAYVAAQLLGALLGVWLAHAMFELPLLQASGRLRAGAGQWLAEGVATAGLVFTVLRAPPARVAPLVAAYIGAACWFTASTAFANPAAVFARMFTDTFTGIAPASAGGFALAELAGGLAGLALQAAFERRGPSAAPAGPSPEPGAAPGKPG